MEVKVAVCGCSWSAISPFAEYKGTHWSEVLCRSNGYELLNLSFGGVSNNVIRMQIDAAISQQADLVIVTPTYFDRIEYPIPNKKYNPLHGLKNIDNNTYKPETSVRSTTLTTLVYDHKVDFAVSYFKNMYVPELKQQVDRWVVRDGISQIKMSGIPFLIQPQLLWNDDAEARQFFSGIAADHNIINKDVSIFHNIWEPGKEFDPGYHTTPRTQEEFATRLHTLIKDSNIIP